MGKGGYGLITGSKVAPQAVLSKILPLSLRASVIYRKKLDNPKACTEDSP
jgi:hypothetical protein